MNQDSIDLATRHIPGIEYVPVFRNGEGYLLIHRPRLSHLDTVIHFADIENALLSHDCFLGTFFAPSCHTPTLVACHAENEEEALAEMVDWLFEHEPGHFAKEGDDTYGPLLETSRGFLYDSYIGVEKVRAENQGRMAYFSGIIKGQQEAKEESKYL